MNHIALKTPEGNITFVFVGDARLKSVFKKWESLKEITEDEHKAILENINSCEWDKKIDFIDGEFVKVEKYSLEEKNKILFEKKVEEKTNLFNSEKHIALRIEEDYRLELEEITEIEMIEVKKYIKSLKPGPGTLEEIPRPEIMYRYDEVK